jgi:predicted aspartyl protease
MTLNRVRVMGEIRVKVKLTNAADEALNRARKLAKKKVRSFEAEAVVDTGAVRSVIPSHVLEKLGVGYRKCRVGSADGRIGSVAVSGGIIFALMDRDTIEEALVLGDEVLIGQTVLEKLDLLADYAGQKLVPNPKHPDHPISMVRRRLVAPMLLRTRNL